MIQAGSMGVPYVPVLGLVGSDLLERRDDMKLVPDPFQPEALTLVAKALRPDVALLHGHKADRLGNVSLGKDTDDVLLAEASRHVMVSVEEVVARLDEQDAQGTFLPGILVDTVVEAPFGAHPSGLPGRYPVDEAHMRHYAQQAQSDEGFRAYLEQTVASVRTHAEYVERFVPADWRKPHLTAAGG